MGCIVQDIEESVGAASSQVIAGIADKSVRDNLRSYMDHEKPVAERRAMAAEYVKGVADGTITDGDIDAASGFYAKFKDGQAQNLHSSLVADGLSHLVNDKNSGITRDTIIKDEAGNDVTVGGVINRANNDRDTLAKGIDANAKIIQGEVDRRNDQADNNQQRSIENGNGINKNKDAIDAEKDRNNQQDKQIGKIEDKQKSIGENVDKNSSEINKNKDAINAEKDRNNQQDKQIGKIEDKQKSIGENVDKNTKDISDNKKLGENNKSRLDEISKGAGDEIGNNRNSIHTEVEKQRKWNAEAEKEQSNWNRSAESAAGKMTTDISKNASSINANRNSIEDNRLSIENLQAKTQQDINRLDNKIDVMEGRLSNGVAMSSAMSQMQFNGGAGVGVGVASFNGSNAIALGAGYSFGSEDQWMLRGSLSHSQTSKGGNQSDTMAGAGVTYSFR
ncbi:hypothetical protein AHAT_14910 [Agarivorans sp. Toyoura001]|uniref:YadA C-terminal domain-containing protein n=1 Tax=Agarivorans sp. Toyoura001 TaxID=2283141 RepID=UPI0010E6A572|nr:YadA C-terminal domain-containing protein [Agarivorans sp. Toyoura001]GDY25601.1 hypothetical protein AHAT_14910 [Agarivorans sp. Toyoura001]